MYKIVRTFGSAQRFATNADGFATKPVRSIYLNVDDIFLNTENERDDNLSILCFDIKRECFCWLPRLWLMELK